MRVITGMIKVLCHKSAGKPVYGQSQSLPI